MSEESETSHTEIKSPTPKPVSKIPDIDILKSITRNDSDRFSKLCYTLLGTKEKVCDVNPEDDKLTNPQRMEYVSTVFSKIGELEDNLLSGPETGEKLKTREVLDTIYTKIKEIT